MKTKGIRFKLTIWYALAFSVAGSLVFLSFYLLTKQALYYQTDSSLTTHGLKVMEVALRAGTGMHDDLAKQAFLDEFAKIPGMLIVIADREGKIIGSSSSANGEAIDSLVKDVIQSNEQSFLNRKVGVTNLRFWTNPIVKDGQPIGVILVAHPIDIIENSLSNLVSAMSIVYVSLVLLTTFGGYWLAKRATKPIREIVEKITRITAENLNERVMVHRSGDEIEELSETFNSLMDRLDSAFKRERQFIGDVAHELKTPLATLQGEIELALSRKRVAAEYKITLSEALVDTKRLGKTLANILDLAWSQADTKMEEVGLTSLTEEIQEIARKLSFQKKIVIKSKIKKGVVVKGRRDKLMRAILNLVDNAIKYTPNKGLVEIGLFEDKDQVVIRVKDSGAGISKIDLPHIFERFYRGNKTEKTLGSGLGLAIAKAIVEAHRGKLVIMSKKGKGTTATISLPKLTRVFMNSSYPVS